MTITAVGAYLWALRESMGLSRDDLAYQTGTNNVQIMRIEKGEIDTRGSLLLSVVKAVHGKAQHVAELLLDERATVEDGQRVAQDWLNQQIVIHGEGMSMEAAALYLRDIRKGRGLTQEKLAELVGVGKRTIERFERNEGSIAAETFEQIIAVLGASAEHVHFLVTAIDASNDDATKLARLLSQERRGFYNNTIISDKAAQAIHLIYQLESDPAALDRLLGYGQSLLDQKR